MTFLANGWLGTTNGSPQRLIANRLGCHCWLVQQCNALSGSLTFLALAFGIFFCLVCQIAISQDNAPIKELPITDADRDHWAFKPIERPALLTTRNTVENPIDAFIAQKLEEKGLTFAPQADKRTLLRRLTFDLTGLPPTEEELAAFLSDNSPLAYEKQVDRLLASPLHGERVALFWLDLARFAETDGFEHDLVRKDAWQYRDWVIDSFNRDLPYDDFTRAQLAGDESGDAAKKIATMFCLAGPDMPDINDQQLRRHDRLNELTSTVGSVFLGLQMGCAQCHDHKYDPLSQADFYRLRALFEPAIPKLQRDKPYDIFATTNPKAEPRFWIRGDVTRPGPELVAAYPRIADSPRRLADRQGDKQPPTRTDFANWLTSRENPLFARVAVNRLWQQHFGKGIFATPSDAGLVGIAPSHEDLLNWLAIELREGDWSTKSLRRKTVLSQTYRQSSRDAEPVQGGEGGPTGAPRDDQPDSNWQKRLELDPENDLYSRFPRRRLDGEAIRDTILLTAGELRYDRGGPGVMAPLPPELLSTLLKGQWTETKDKSQHTRRSIYLFARRNLRYPLFEAFDRPDANTSCPIRNKSTTPSQALVLLHGEFPIQMAKALASKLVKANPDADESSRKRQLEKLFKQTLNREPTESEQELAKTFLTDQSMQIAKEHSDWTPKQVVETALADAALALFNSSEFLYIE